MADNVVSLAALVATAVPWLYCVILFCFRCTVYEIDTTLFSLAPLSLGVALLELADSTSLVLAACTIHHFKLSPIYYCFLGLRNAFLSLGLYKKYVQGRKFDKVDLSGKVFIVTGCNTGIGRLTVRHFYMKNIYRVE